MNKYEITFIVRPDMEEAEIKKNADAMKKVLTDKSAKVEEEKALGQRDLAYEVKKYKTGYYYFLVVSAEPEAIEEFNRVVKINESVIRHLVVRVDD